MLKLSTATPGPTVIDLLGQPHKIKSESTKLGKECEAKARYILEMLGYRCTDAGEGYEYDLLAHSDQGILRIQVKALALSGTNPLRRICHNYNGKAIGSNYAANAFDFLMLICRDSSKYYLIPASELISNGHIKANVKHIHFSNFHFH